MCVWVTCCTFTEHKPSWLAWEGFLNVSTLGLFLSLCSMKDSASVCAGSVLHSARRGTNTVWMVIGQRAALWGFSGMVVVLKWCPLSTRLLGLRRPGGPFCFLLPWQLWKRAPCPSPGVLIWWPGGSSARTHTHTPIHKHTLASVCWHLTPHTD